MPNCSFLLFVLQNDLLKVAQGPDLNKMEVGGGAGVTVLVCEALKHTNFLKIK